MSNSIAVDAVLGEAQNDKKLRLSDRLFAALFNHLVYPQFGKIPRLISKPLT